MLEALACGVPVVCSDVPSLREVAGGQALHVPVGDVEALTDALESVVKSSADAATLAARGGGHGGQAALRDAGRVLGARDGRLVVGHELDATGEVDGEPDVREVLASEIDALLAGKALAPPAGAEVKAAPDR